LLVPFHAVRESLKNAKKDFTKTEDDLKSLQSVGQIIGEVLRPLDNERCKSSAFPVSLDLYPCTQFTGFRVNSFPTIKEHILVSVFAIPLSLVAMNENTAVNL